MRQINKSKPILVITTRTESDVQSIREDNSPNILALKDDYHLIVIVGRDVKLEVLNSGKLSKRKYKTILNSVAKTIRVSG